MIKNKLESFVIKATAKDLKRSLSMDFNGADYDQARDKDRLTSQAQELFNLMKDSNWRTLSQIALLTSFPAASISAQLRNFRKASFGGHTVNRKHVSNGLYMYQLIENKG